MDGVSDFSQIINQNTSEITNVICLLKDNDT